LKIIDRSAASRRASAQGGLQLTVSNLSGCRRWDPTTAVNISAQGFSLSDAARSVGTSERTLARRLRTVLGKSPLSYFQDLRVERAVHLLQTSNASVERIASEIGYSDLRGAVMATRMAASGA
jgi:AraC-like DNA-binding protein